MGFVPGRLHLPQISIVPQQHAVLHEIDNAIPRPDSSAQYNARRLPPNPLRHFVQSSPKTQSAFEQVLEKCIPDYAHDPLFREFAEAAGFRIIPYEEYAREFIALPKPYPETRPPDFRPDFRARLQGKEYVAEPTGCPNTLFGYWADYFEDELWQAVNKNPYEYYKLFIKTAKENPDRIYALFDKAPGLQSRLYKKVREILGAVAATDEFAKKIYERHGGGSMRKPPNASDDVAKAKVEAFTKEADRKMTREQVKQVAVKYLPRIVRMPEPSLP